MEDLCRREATDPTSLRGVHDEAIHSAEEKQGDGLPRSPFDSAALRSGSARNDAKKFLSFFWKGEGFSFSKLFRPSSFLIFTFSFFLLTAIFLTFSRGAWLALAIGGGVFLLAGRRWKTLLAVFLAGALAISFSPRARERLAGALDLDVTAGMRVESWANAVSLWRENPLFGIGWNFFPEAAARTGEIRERKRAAAGSDSSFLTALAATGTLGGLFWLGFVGEALALAWRRRELFFFSASLAVFAGSFFSNCLFFSPILLAWLGWLAIFLAESLPGKREGGKVFANAQVVELVDTQP